MSASRLGLFTAAMWLMASVVFAQAVQLPTYSYFGTGTTVTVPDRGSAYLGGVNRAASGLNESRVPLLPFVPFKNRSMGSERSASNASVSVYIHDFEAMEEELLSRPSGGSARLMPRDRGRSEPLLARTRSGSGPSPAVAAANRQDAPQPRSPEEEARQYYQRGQQLEAEGKPNIAVIYYRMASRRGGGELQEEILARLAALQAPKAPPRLAQQDR